MTLVEPTHPALRKKSIPLKARQDVSTLIDEMFKLCALGLAAPQIGENIKLFITQVDVDEKMNKRRRVFINPKIIKKFGSIRSEEEGCLSLPNVIVNVPRHDKVYIEFYDSYWVYRKEIFSGLLSRVIQHEQDHLNGKLITDYL